MFTSFRCLVISDCSATDGTPIFPQIMQSHPYGWVFSLAYCITWVCMTVGLSNVIVAIYVENTVATAKHNEGLTRQRRLANVTRFASHIVSLTRFLWLKKHPEEPFIVETALEMNVERDFFKSVVDNYEMHHLLQDLDVPKEDHLDLFDICDADGSGVLSVDELVTGVKRLRGDPRRSDIVFVMLRINEALLEMQEMRAEVLQSHTDMKEDLQSMAEIKADLRSLRSVILSSVSS